MVFGDSVGAAKDVLKDSSLLSCERVERGSSPAVTLRRSP
jgi:hypothetical protein